MLRHILCSEINPVNSAATHFCNLSVNNTTNQFSSSFWFWFLKSFVKKKFFRDDFKLSLLQWHCPFLTLCEEYYFVCMCLAYPSTDRVGLGKVTHLQTSFVVNWTSFPFFSFFVHLQFHSAENNLLTLELASEKKSTHEELAKFISFQ